MVRRGPTPSLIPEIRSRTGRRSARAAALRSLGTGVWYRLVPPEDHSGATALLRLDPGEHVGAVVPAVPAELDAGQLPAPRVLADPPRRNAQQLGDLSCVEETLAVHRSPSRARGGVFAELGIDGEEAGWVGALL